MCFLRAARRWCFDVRCRAHAPGLADAPRRYAVSLSGHRPEVGQERNTRGWYQSGLLGEVLCQAEAVKFHRAARSRRLDVRCRAHAGDLTHAPRR